MMRIIDLSTEKGHEEYNRIGKEAKDKNLGWVLLSSNPDRPDMSWKGTCRVCLGVSKNIAVWLKPDRLIFYCCSEECLNMLSLSEGQIANYK